MKTLKIHDKSIKNRNRKKKLWKRKSYCDNLIWYVLHDTFTMSNWNRNLVKLVKFYLINTFEEENAPLWFEGETDQVTIVRICFSNINEIFNQFIFTLFSFPFSIYFKSSLSAKGKWSNIAAFVKRLFRKKKEFVFALKTHMEEIWSISLQIFLWTISVLKVNVP